MKRPFYPLGPPAIFFCTLICFIRPLFPSDHCCCSLASLLPVSLVRMLLLPSRRPVHAAVALARALHWLKVDLPRCGSSAGGAHIKGGGNIVAPGGCCGLGGSGSDGGLGSSNFGGCNGGTSGLDGTLGISDANSDGITAPGSSARDRDST